MSTPVKPDITPYLEAIENAVYGEEVRGSIHDAIEAVNDYADEFYTDAKEQAQAAANSASSASGYATTASTKAGEASASATAAGNAETAAKNAKTDAIDAKNLANTYAGNAATSAAQAAASAQAAAAAGPILVDTVGWMCKNRVPLTLESLKALNTLGTWADNVYTRNDVDFTVNTNSEGYVTSIVMNGTASGFASLTLLDDTIANLSEILPQGNYIVNGCPDGGAMLSGYSMRFKVDTETYYITDSDDMTVAVSGSSSYQVTWSLACTSGTSVSSKTFKPMIRKAAIADNTFEPYHKDVETYVENKIYDVYGVMGENGAKNKLGIKLATIKSLNTGSGVSWNDNAVTIGNITYTITTDSSGYVTKIKVNGTASENSILLLTSAGTPFDKGDFKFNGLQNVADTEKFYVTFYDDATQTSGSGTYRHDLKNKADNDVTITQGYVGYLRIVILQNAVIDNVEIFPMLRDARDTNPDYQPPAMTNAELTDKVVVKDVKSLITPQNSATIESAFRSGNMVSVKVKIPANTPSNTVLATLDNSIKCAVETIADTYRFALKRTENVQCLDNSITLFVPSGQTLYDSHMFATVTYMTVG